jgi:hypothetical protein
VLEDMLAKYFFPVNGEPLMMMYCSMAEINDELFLKKQAILFAGMLSFAQRCVQIDLLY